MINKCIDNGLLLVNAGKHVIRFLPPLSVKKEEIDEAIEIFSQVLKELNV
ncbi:MAG: aminotransferase class III-fold pyridoxal phosphate-dependent enzyme [Promethearchaeota archaeon]